MLLLSFGVIPKVWSLITYKKTTGIIRYFNQHKYYLRGYLRYSQSPVVDFVVNNKTYEFYENKFMRDAYWAGDTVKVIYDPTFKEKAYINTFPGIWAPEVTYVIPAALVLFLIFGLASISKSIKIAF